jgi:D-alanine transaminase
VPEIAYVNGRIGSIDEAFIGIEDRGFQFADGVYEVVRSYARRLMDLDRHLARLERSAKMLDLPLPMDLADLEATCRSFFAQSGLDEAVLYLQVTRGVARRQHVAPAGLTPTLVMTARVVSKPTPAEFRVITVPNNRWRMCDCKTIALLPTVLAKHAAAQVNGDDAIFVEDDGTVLEGASDNIFVVKSGVIYTAPADNRILAGITRGRVLEIIDQLGLLVRIEPYKRDFMMAADEVFLTSSVLTVVPIVEVDARAIADGKPGPVAQRLCRAYWDLIRATAV